MRHLAKPRDASFFRVFFNPYHYGVLTYGLVDFDEQLVRHLVEKITIFQRYMEFTFKDGEVIRVNM